LWRGSVVESGEGNCVEILGKAGKNMGGEGV